MYNLKSLNEFIIEQSNISKIRQKLSSATNKVDKFQAKSRAASEEANFRKEQLKYEQNKERLQNNRDSAQTPVDKAKYKEELKNLREKWVEDKKKLKDRIRQLRNLV